ncbi:MAG: DUF480 domain-containing protein [Planctomycetota bacterium]
MNENQESATPAWTALSATDRRVLGVLVEKAKTTPNNYPLSLNAIMTGSNQKSNRAPHMSLDTDDVEDSLERLREAGAVAEVHGGGRVVKYRHYMKDWMGVDGTELAVMAELLLRGAQTVGELRGRAARMAGSSLPDMGSLRPVLASLVEKNLVIELTPAGRGQVVTHGLYSEREIREIKDEYGGGVAPSPRPAAAPAAPTSTATQTPATPSSPPSDSPASESSSSAASSASSNADVQSLRAEVDELRAEVARMKKEIEDLWSNIS